jgi:membrane protein
MLAPGEWKALAVDSVRGWIDDHAPSMGAAVAFYTLFSLAPLLLLVIALVGPIFGERVARGLVVEQIARVTGDTAAAGITELLKAAAPTHRDPFQAIVGTLTLLLGATTVFGELQADLNRIWRYQPPTGGGVLRFVRARVAAFSLVMTVGALMLASVGATTWLTWIARQGVPQASYLLHAGEFAASFVVLTLLFAAIYKLLPSARIAWSDVWVGAAVTSMLFWLGKLLISLYLAKKAIGSTFGAAGAIVVVIAWVYYSAQVFFLGAEFTRQYALRHGSRSQ